jgi:DNA replication protein DnaC
MSTLENTLKQLRLSGLLQTLDVRLQEATADRLGYAEFLELICQDEVNVRQQRLMERRTKAADFRGLKTLEDFDWSFDPAVQLPKNSGEHLFEVIMRRYENRSTIMTSNRPLEEWGKLLGDVPTAGAILDRFLHHA